MSALTVLSLAGCPPPHETPEFVGTWFGHFPQTGTATITFTETTFTALITGNVPDTESIAGTITSFDESSKHILAVVATESYTGAVPTKQSFPGDKLYMLYSLSGTTLTMASSKTEYPVDLSGGMAMTKQ